jgi:hypothetical protein
LSGCALRLLLSAGLGDFQSEDEVTDVNLIAFANDGGLGYFPTVDVGAVRAFQVANDEATVPIKQSGVVFGDVAFGQHQLVALYAAYVNFGLIKDLATLGAAFFRDYDREHAVPEAQPKQIWPMIVDFNAIPGSHCQSTGGKVPKNLNNFHKGDVDFAVTLRKSEAGRELWAMIGYNRSNVT